jgi:arsenate reductase (thioredoxin)
MVDIAVESAYYGTSRWGRPGRFSNPEAMILFVCQHGSAKSVIAANHFNQLAEAKGLSLRAASAGLEPGPELPQQTVDGMAGDGIDVRQLQPSFVSPDQLAAASRIVSFECDVSSIARVTAPVEMWTGVPMVSDGYTTARDIIVNRVAELFDALEADVHNASK